MYDDCLKQIDFIVSGHRARQPIPDEIKCLQLEIRLWRFYYKDLLATGFAKVTNMGYIIDMKIKEVEDLKSLNNHLRRRLQASTAEIDQLKN